MQRSGLLAAIALSPRTIRYAESELVRLIAEGQLGPNPKKENPPIPATGLGGDNPNEIGIR